jgi:(1->4)-alpha-D-glucan 1-alpha-D-glucosylmutase
VSGARVPSSTYRLQFHADFTFADATSLVPYLADLGVGACYASPYLKATPGTRHGYDICDHNALNPELGDAVDYAAFSAALHAHRLGQILDFVPNHMGIDAQTNTWWRDVLENGPGSPFADYFDVDWAPVTSGMRDKVLLPILGDHYGRELERGRLQLRFESGRLGLTYYQHRLPINPKEGAHVYGHEIERLRTALGEDSADLREFLSILTALHNLPAYTERDPARVAERQRESEVARGRLVHLVARCPEIARHLQAAIQAFNGVVGDRASYDALDELLERQAYRLAFWRTALDEINYRRFFDINNLAALRMEDPRVFHDTHGLLARLIADGAVTGVRVDHPDGLYDPAGYFSSLQELAREALGPASAEDELPLYVLAEKILAGPEELPDWPIHGTTGYEFLNALNGVFVDSDGLGRLRRHYARFTGRKESFAEEALVSKRLIMQTTLASELNVLAHALYDVARQDRRTRDFTLGTLGRALLEVVAAMPIYRTYIRADGPGPSDRAAINRAVAEAERRNPAAERATFRFVRQVLLTEVDDGPAAGASPWRRDAIRRVAMRFQQFTAPVHAKGVEDTAFYRHNVLLSLNEVGGDPAAPVLGVDGFHRFNLQRRERWPYAMTTTATHDTKRGEDARARLNVLSEISEEWIRAASRWARVNAKLRTTIDQQPAPDGNDEYLFYQALLSVWPPEPADAPVPSRAPEGLTARLTGFVLKAAREAKLHTSWIASEEAYEAALTAFVERTLDSPDAARFLPAFVPFARRVARFGAVNSLAQLVLKIAAPGVPDIYQGSELWDLHLVDPDNRQPVDFETRRTSLREFHSGSPLDSTVSAAAKVTQLLDSWHDGRIKLWITARALNARRDLPELFLDGDYVPLHATGAQASRIVALSRAAGGKILVAATCRLATALASGDRGWPIGEIWQDTTVQLPSGFRSAFRSVLTDEIVHPHVNQSGSELRVAEVFRSCPAALLIADA